MPLGVRIHVGFWSLFLAASSAETFYVHETTLTSLPLRGRIYRWAGQTAAAPKPLECFFKVFEIFGTCFVVLWPPIARRHWL